MEQGEGRTPRSDAENCGPVPYLTMKPKLPTTCRSAIDLSCGYVQSQPHAALGEFLN